MSFRSGVVFMLAVLCCSAALAQQTGAIAGTVRDTGGAPLPGVTVEARSPVLPQARVTNSEVDGGYTLPQLPPGDYTLTFSLAGMQTQTRNVRVLLDQTATVNVALGVEALAETIVVTADAPLVDPTSTEIKSAVSEDVIDNIPTGQQYRDLLKLAPAVQYSEDIIRGPSSGGSGQDNVYQLDGVNISLPLYGTLSAEPSSHDIDQVSVLKGGAKALDFNRAAGFTIDSVSKSGTNEWKGELKYQFQSADFTAEQDFEVQSVYDQDRDWLTLGVGGPLFRERLFFYGSYFRPTTDRANSANVYGEIPDEKSTRNEYFGKLTFTPTGNFLIHGSYRDSSREVLNTNIEATESAQGAVTEEAGLEIGILEGSWVITPRSFATFKFNDYANLTSATADFRSGAVPTFALGTTLDLNNLDALGRFVVPSPDPARPAFTQYAQQFIDRYGFVNATGARVGGGFVGPDPESIDDIDFFRRSGQLGFDLSLGANLTHDLHFGVQRYEDAEELTRVSNGWGIIRVIGGTANCPAGTECAGQPHFLHAEFLRSVTGVGQGLIRSEFRSDNFEINDTVRWNDWFFNFGVLVSNDQLYGQGLREDSSTLSGYVLDPGNRYLMYEVPWEKQIQPRVGATWAYNSRDSVYVSYARYSPSVTSLPRAASWDRNQFSQLYDVYFDAQGRLIGSRERGGSSGKLFVEDLDPRYTDEYLIGTSRQITPGLAARVYARHRYSTNFWEDTNNNARVAFAPPEGVPRELYIPDLDAMREQICASNRVVCPAGRSGSTYVIAELDGAFTRYWEATLESEYRQGNAFVSGTYTWSHYYGNFDQDNTTTNNDLSIFMGSSFIADAAGRQIWNFRYGDLRADRRHLLKMFGYYTLPWNATAGAFGVYQSGHKWEAWSWEPYQNLTTSRSSTSRYAEPAGSRTTPAHYQVDLNYTQNIPIQQLNLQLIADLYNVFDNQTGYSPDPVRLNQTFGNFRLHYAPRRFQLAARLQF